MRRESRPQVAQGLRRPLVAVGCGSLQHGRRWLGIAFGSSGPVLHNLIAVKFQGPEPSFTVLSCSLIRLPSLSLCTNERACTFGIRLSGQRAPGRRAPGRHAWLKHSA